MFTARRNVVLGMLLSPLVFVAAKVRAYTYGYEDLEFTDLDGDISLDPGDPVIEPIPAPAPAPAPAPVKTAKPLDPFDAKMKYAQDQIAARNFTRTIKYLNDLGVQKKPRNEARRLFHLARATAGKKRYADAIGLNEKALALNPSQVTSRFNNGCYACLAGNNKNALHHLRMMVDYLTAKKSSQSRRFMKMMESDADLTPLRPLNEFRQLTLELAKV